jgi:hypothetical protein
MQRKITRFTVTLVMAVSGLLTVGASAASATPPGLVETLKANPGSVRTGENAVLLKTGVLVGFPNGKVGIEAAKQCPQTFTCVWWDTNFEGPMAGIKVNTSVWMRDYWVSPNKQTVLFSPGVKPDDGWENFFNKVSSLYNNTAGTTAGFHASFQIPGGYSATYGKGSMVSYVGAYYNDSFDKACICL